MLSVKAFVVWASVGDTPAWVDTAASVETTALVETTVSVEETAASVAVVDIAASDGETRTWVGAVLTGTRVVCVEAKNNLTNRNTVSVCKHENLLSFLHSGNAELFVFCAEKLEIRKLEKQRNNNTLFFNSRQGNSEFLR